jgi:hypothetical protein
MEMENLQTNVRGLLWKRLQLNSLVQALILYQAEHHPIFPQAVGQKMTPILSLQVK